MDNLTLFAGLAGITAVWSQIRSIFDRIRGLFIQRTTLNGHVAYTVTDYLYSQTRVWRWGDAYIRSESTWVRPRARVLEVAYETASSAPVVAFWKRVPLIFYSASHPQGLSNVPECSDRITLITLRGTLNVSDLIRDAIDWQSIKETTGRRYRVRHIGGKRESAPRNEGGGLSAAPPAVPYGERMRPGTRYLHWCEDEIGAPRQDDPFKSYALAPATSACREDFKRWCQLKNWYLERGIPWRRGHLLYGPPGTGKTALVRAIAQESDFPVFAFDLSTLDNNQFRDAWNDMQESAPCIALIEDIDGVFQGRTNVLGSQDHRPSLTFDCLLNAIGGIQTADGVFLVITTNKPDTLDEALGKPTDTGTSSRPGRIDRAFLVPHLDADGRARIIARICGSAEQHDTESTDGMSAAQVTEYAITKALAATWQSTPPDPAASPADPAA